MKKYISLIVLALVALTSCEEGVVGIRYASWVYSALC